MKIVRVALIGAGEMANSVHYPSLAEFTDVELVGLCDVVAEKRSATAAKFGIRQTFADYRQMLKAVEPQAAYILMPPHQLFDVTVDCLEAGLHVFIEKPPGLTTFQTTELARHAEKNGCLTMVGFNRRFIPLLVRAKQAVLERGPIIQCTSTFMKSAPDLLYYRGAIDTLTCDAIHAVDALRWMGGEVKRLVSHVAAFGSSRENAWNALVEFESGAVGHLCANWAVGARIHTFEMHGVGISARIDPGTGSDPRSFARIQHDGHEMILTSEEAAGSTALHKAYGFYQESRHFIDCLQSGQQPQTHFADAAETMMLVDRIRNSRM
jgi:predicted dehydrogenase